MYIHLASFDDKEKKKLVRSYFRFTVFRSFSFFLLVIDYSVPLSVPSLIPNVIRITVHAIGSRNVNITRNHNNLL